MPEAQINKLLPDFSLASTAGDFRLSALRGSIVALYFYPRDDTPGCTMESKDFRDRHAEFEQNAAKIFGVSRDSLASHEKFKRKHALPFPLLSDPDELACQLFGVMKRKNMYGKMARGIERSTFLIDKDGVLRREWRKLKVPGHVDAVLAEVKALRAQETLKPPAAKP